MEKNEDKSKREIIFKEDTKNTRSTVVYSCFRCNWILFFYSSI